MVFWGFFGWVFLGGFFNANPEGTVIKDTHNFMLFPNSLKWNLKTAPKKSYRQKTFKIVENSKNFKFSTLRV